MGFFSKLFGGEKKEEAAGGLGTCIACDGSDLAELAPQAYRCNTCGYEGGDGFAEYKANQAVASLEEKPEAALRELALEQLESVRLMVVGVGGEVKKKLLAKAAGLSQGVEIAENLTLAVTVGMAEEVGIGEGLGVLGQAAKEERERLRQQRKMDLLEAQAAVRELRQTLLAWSAKEGHDSTVDEALSLIKDMVVDENTPDRRLHEIQVLVERARNLLAL